MKCLLVGFLLIAAILNTTCLGAKYFVDFDGGSDTATGASADAAFKHCPGDANAVGKAKDIKLQPGDTVIFKGGVHYRGSIATAKGKLDGSPVIYDGNTSDNFGTGKAVIDGSVKLTGWKRCQSAEDAGGNPNWEKLWYNYIDGNSTIFSANLCQNNQLLNIAQHPNAGDKFFFDLLDYWQTTKAPYIQTLCAVDISTDEKTTYNRSRPLILAADDNPSSSTIINNLPTAVLHFDLKEAETIESVAITSAPNYTSVDKFEIYGDGKLLLSGNLKKNNTSQQFKLKEPASIKKLTFKSKSIHKSNRDWGAIAEIAAFNASGENVLLANAKSAYCDPEFFSQTDKDFWQNATVALYARPAAVYYQKVLDFDTETNTLIFELFSGMTYENTHGRIAILNAPKTVDVPGEYAIIDAPAANGSKKVILYPHQSGRDDLDGLTFSKVKDSRHNCAFNISGSENITIQGFELRQFAGRRCGAISGTGSKNILIRNNLLRLQGAHGRSAAIGIADSDKVIIQNCDIRFNRRCNGVILHTCTNSIVQQCLLDSNGSTGVSRYGCKDTKLLDNTVFRHKAVHANGLTMYVGCENMLVEGNRVFDGNVSLTAQHGENITIQNNILDSFGNAQTIGLWSGRPLKNVYIYNNLILRGMHNDWAAALYCDNAIEGDFIIRNNVIDGWAINKATPTHSHNVFTHLGPEGKQVELNDTESFCSDLEKLFVNPLIMDYRPIAGAPTVDKGIEIKGRIADMLKSPVPAGKAPDIGPIEYREKPWK